MTAYLLDTNVLLRLLLEDDPLYAEVRVAVNRLESRGELLHFAPQDAAELWNVLTRPKQRNGSGLSPAEADALLSEAEALFDLLPDVSAMYTHWRRLVRGAGVSGVRVHDARLVASMQAHAVTHLLTLNARDFARYVPLTGIVVVEPAHLAGIV